MATNNKSGMSISKHRNSGVAPKSPKIRHRMRLEAEKQERKAKESLPFSSVQELFK